ncbi:hypothetical protein AB0H57_20505 [Micromonospora sp. NPDC050686]|uniref:hypothetical protein n=1 Tax=Micromonospora sp. NPDC050686 TaxID=3154631 RepID=UPI0033F20A72
MSFDVFLQRFGARLGDAGVARRVLAPLLVTPSDDGFGVVRTRDGEADVYGLGTDTLMFTHASGRQIWQVVVDVAQATGYAIMPVGCPTCVTRLEHLADLPDELRSLALVVLNGDDLLAAVTGRLINLASARGARAATLPRTAAMRGRRFADAMCALGWSLMEVRPATRTPPGVR